MGDKTLKATTGSTPAAEWVAIDTLAPWDKNPRRNDEAAKEVAKSIQRFGFGAPILARSADRVVIAGHTRLKAAALLKLDKVPVRFLDLDPAEARALALADNKLGELADWDEALLGDVLRDLEADGASLDGLGFTDDELKALLADSVVEPSENDDDTPEVDEHGEPDSVLGGVYELGPHRLVCGDSTTSEAWALLMGGAVASCIVTDPPYGMSYKGNTFGKQGLSNDGDGEFESVLSAGMVAAFAHAPNSLAAVCFGASRLDRYFRAIAPLAEFCRLLVIYKPNSMAHPWRGWIMTSEVIGLWSHGSPEWAEPANHCHDVYTFDYSERPDRSVNHPTVKPLFIIVDLVRKLSGPGATVLDPFGGSGTTLIAAAQTGRIARLIELDPRYCDVIRRRWTRWAREHGRDPGPGALDG